MVKKKGGRWKKGKQKSEESGDDGEDAEREVGPANDMGDMFLPYSHKLRCVLDEDGIGDESPQRQFQQMNWQARKLVTYGGPRYADKRKCCYLDKKYPHFEVTFVARARGVEAKEITVRIKKSDVYVDSFKAKRKWYGYSDEENIFGFTPSCLKSHYGNTDYPGISAKLFHEVISDLADFDNGSDADPILQGYMYLIFWWVSEAVRFKSIYDQIYRVLGGGWSYSEDRLPEDKKLVRKWRKTSIAIIDAYFDSESHFEVVDVTTGITTYEEAKERVVVLALEDRGRVFNRWPVKYRSKGSERPPLLLPNPKGMKRTDEQRNTFWRTCPKEIRADQWRSFERFANVCRDGRTDVAEELLTRMDVVEVINFGHPTIYTLRFVDRKLQKVMDKKFPKYLFEARNDVEYYSDEEHDTLMATDSDPDISEVSTCHVW